MNEFTVQLTAWLLGLIAAAGYHEFDNREYPIWEREALYLVPDIADQAIQAAALARWE